MRNLAIMAIGLVSVLCGLTTQAQTDPHYSQYYIYPLWLNPGLTGVMDGDYRVTAIYRRQWDNVSGPYVTPGVSADISTNKNVSLGLNIMNQQAGSGGYNYLTAYASMAYTGVRFGADGNHRISMGMSLGLISRRFDQSKFQTDEMWDPQTGATLGNDEVLNKTAGSNFDAGAGIMYYDATPGKKMNLFAGFSAFHLTQPEDPFIADGEPQKMPVRYTAHGGAQFNVSEAVSVTPNLLYMRQGQATEKMIGAYTQFRVNEDADFLLGANYRFKDALVPYAGVYYKNFVLGVSYDVGTSDLSKVTGKANSFELSLSVIGSRAFKAKRIPFVCPAM
ncbi:MAG TPA: PorP/SprF family type IX secretion system membrane protein [Niastella sp.]